MLVFIVDYIELKLFDIWHNSWEHIKIYKRCYVFSSLNITYDHIWCHNHILLYVSYAVTFTTIYYYMLTYIQLIYFEYHNSCVIFVFCDPQNIETTIFRKKKTSSHKMDPLFWTFQIWFKIIISLTKKLFIGGTHVQYY